jgi:hypothetical protein
MFINVANAPEGRAVIPVDIARELVSLRSARGYCRRTTSGGPRTGPDASRWTDQSFVESPDMPTRGSWHLDRMLSEAG